MAIKETKKEDFSTRCLNSISTRIDVWHWLPSIGRSGEILFGCDSNKVKILTHTLHIFCVDVVLENKLDNNTWQLIVAYGPVIRNLKQIFWDELNSIRNRSLDLWFICGDFN